MVVIVVVVDICTNFDAVCLQKLRQVRQDQILGKRLKCAKGRTDGEGDCLTLHPCIQVLRIILVFAPCFCGMARTKHPHWWCNTYVLVLEHLSTRPTVMPPLHVNPPKIFWDRRRLLVPCESLDVQAFSRWVDWLIRSSSVPSDRRG